MDRHQSEYVYIVHNSQYQVSALHSMNTNDFWLSPWLSLVTVSYNGIVQSVMVCKCHSLMRNIIASSMDYSVTQVVVEIVIVDIKITILSQYVYKLLILSFQFQKRSQRQLFHNHFGHPACSHNTLHTTAFRPIPSPICTPCNKTSGCGWINGTASFVSLSAPNELNS